MAVERLNEWRRPGCGDGCREVYAFLPGLTGRERLELHDPDAHEAWGSQQAGLLAAGEVVTGPLRISLTTQDVWLASRPITLTPTEWLILETLARCPGQWVRYGLVHRTLQDFNGCYADPANALTAHLNRLRAALGPAGGVIETWRSYGLRLRVLAEGEPLPEPQSNRRYSRYWAPRRAGGQP